MTVKDSGFISIPTQRSPPLRSSHTQWVACLVPTNCYIPSRSLNYVITRMISPLLISAKWEDLLHSHLLHDKKASPSLVHARLGGSQRHDCSVLRSHSPHSFAVVRTVNFSACSRLSSSASRSTFPAIPLPSFSKNAA